MLEKNDKVIDMGYPYSFKVKNVGGRETYEELDLADYVSIQIEQRQINEKLVSVFRLIDRNGYKKTLDFGDRKEDAADFLQEWEKYTKTNGEEKANL